MSDIFINSFKNAKTLIKWVFFAVLIGIICGFIGNLFHHSIEIVTELRFNYPKIMIILPIGGVIIAWMYHIFSEKGKLDTKRIINAVSDEKDVPIVILPLIFISSVITHLVGGSSGREGAALQIGGSLGYNIGNIFKLKKNEIKILVMAGMCAAFSALFGTPVASLIFTFELTNISVRNIKTLLVCVISSFSGYIISLSMSASPVRFDISGFSEYSLELITKTIIIALICAAVSIIFCFAIKKTELYSKMYLKNVYIRGFIGGVLILIMTILIGSYDYNGAGMHVIERAFSGDVKNEAFILKIIFTAITVASGFKGGEIVPAFFVGSTLGCSLGRFIGIEPGFGAAIGFITLFCGITKCPFASFFLALEVFGPKNSFIFVLICLISYIFSGNTGILRNKKDVQ